MRNKIGYRTTSKEVYLKFKEEHPDMDISYDKFKEIVYGFAYEMRDIILETGEKLSLPFGLGELSINKKKTRRFNKYNKIILPVDWVATKKAGKKVYNFNHHTEGYKFKWIWFRQKTRFPMSRLWAFKPARKTSRKLAEYLKQPNSQYQFIYREWQK